MASVKNVLAESGLTDLTIDTGKATLIFSGGTITQVNWEEPNTAEVVE